MHPELEAVMVLIRELGARDQQRIAQMLGRELVRIEERDTMTAEQLGILREQRNAERVAYARAVAEKWRLMVEKLKR